MKLEINQQMEQLFHKGPYLSTGGSGGGDVDGARASSVSVKRKQICYLKHTTNFGFALSC